MGRHKAIASAVIGSVTAIIVVAIVSVLSEVITRARDESFNAKMTSLRIATGVECGSTAVMLTLASLAIAMIVSLVVQRRLIAH